MVTAQPHNMLVGVQIPICMQNVQVSTQRHTYKSPPLAACSLRKCLTAVQSGGGSAPAQLATRFLQPVKLLLIREVVVVLRSLQAFAMLSG